MATPASPPTPGARPGPISRVSRGRLPDSLDQLAGSEMGKAVGLAGAMIANNVIALGATIVFARLLSDSHGGGYGSLAALVSYFLILSVFGQALQVATAREGVLGHLGVGAELVATTRRWSRSLLAFTVLLGVVSVLARVPIADAVGVRHDQWAAALGLPAAGLWLWLSTLAGTLQGIGEYRDVSISLIGQQAVRLPVGALLAAAGLGVFGAFAGSSVAFLAMGTWCLWRIRRHGEAAEAALAVPRSQADPAAPRLIVHLRRAWAPIIGLIVIAVLQNIDIIAAKHRFSTSMATSYGAVAVAAKVLIWVAMGAGFYLVPEVSRRRANGGDPRPILARALCIVAVCAVPVLLLYAFAAHLLIRVGFGADHTGASGSLLVLGLAFTALAATYLAVQYLLALHRTWFLAPLALVAVAEPILLLHASRRPTGFATVVLGIQIAGAVIAYGFALRAHRGHPATPPGPVVQGGIAPDAVDVIPEAVA
jgi:O-antigen/teichoic acid export membrane protein